MSDTNENEDSLVLQDVDIDKEENPKEQDIEMRDIKKGDELSKVSLDKGGKENIVEIEKEPEPRRSLDGVIPSDEELEAESADEEEEEGEEDEEAMREKEEEEEEKERAAGKVKGFFMSVVRKIKKFFRFILHFIYHRKKKERFFFKMTLLEWFSNFIFLAMVYVFLCGWYIGLLYVASIIQGWELF